MSSSPTHLKDRRGRKYTPAVGPGLKPFLWTVLFGFALLGANGAYLSAISAVSWFRGVVIQTPFYLLMFALHLVLGFALVVPFLIFGFAHLATSWKRPNRVAVRYGLVLLSTAMIVLISGLVLVRLGVFEVRDPNIRRVSYWLHVITPVMAIGLYIRHRLAGPRIHWEWAWSFGGVVVAFVVAMGLLHFQDPRKFGVRGPKEGNRYFFPSEAVTATGKFIPEKVMMMDSYCLKCHPDAYKSWLHSAHHFSSFNNPAYLASVRETRKVSLERDGNTRAARWCAGCHDPVPFYSGQFDNPSYDDVHTPSSQAGITCISCHSIVNVHSTRGNGSYTIEEPQQYPFATSESPILQYINNALVKAKPEMHKQTFLKPLHKDSKFCSTCHKVSLPYALNHYKDFLRGQNHYDSFWLSGVSGHGARSFYYPPEAKNRCVDCHMNLIPSRDFGARDFDGKGGREIHSHLFPGANTGLAAIRGQDEIVQVHSRYLSENKVRIDIFGLREGGEVDGKLLGPIRPELPELEAGKNYLVEVVVRTLGLGHALTEGTADSNEIWVALEARLGDRVLGRSGGIGSDGGVDPYSHFINIYMLDREGNRIERRNPQDIFTPLYNKQIAPGSGQVVHFGLELPAGIKGPIVLEAKVNYRKFDRKYMNFVFGEGKGPVLPVVVMAKDKVELPIGGGPEPGAQVSPIKEEWQRWNDYGIGLLLEGGDKGAEKGELKQAEPVFQKVVELGQVDGWVNLARVYQKEGRIADALKALEHATKHEKPAAPWVIAWLTGQINARNGYMNEAIDQFESVLATKVPARGFDFSQDYLVLNELGAAYFGRASQELLDSPMRPEFMRKAAETYRRTIAIDSENVAAHYGLGLAFSDLARWGLVARERVNAPTVEADRAARALQQLEQETAPRAIATGEAQTPEELVDSMNEHLTMLADRKYKPSVRVRGAVEIAREVPLFAAGPRPQFGSKLEPLHEVAQTLGALWEREGDPSARTAMAHALAATHKALHAMLKPDETAQGRAVRIARQNSPAADQNAQSIVIHSLQRPAATGN
ncbi:MAG TPA: multiheme c-type cytochrome [Isosphaeraceae bacterium]|nr:multiheme c-type cytochrome [Isosphaeraceae bacterium]